MNEVEEFIYQKEAEQKELLLFLHNFLVSEFHLLAKIRFKIPFYYKNNWVIYLNPLKNNNIDFCVLRANEQETPHEPLNFKSRKQVASIELDPKMDLKLEIIKSIIQDALEIDKKPYHKVSSKK